MPNFKGKVLIHLNLNSQPSTLGCMPYTPVLTVQFSFKPSFKYGIPLIASMKNPSLSFPWCVAVNMYLGFFETGDCLWAGGCSCQYPQAQQL